MKVPHLVLAALAALCLTGCPDQDSHPNSSGSKSGQSKPSYTVPEGDGLMLVALAGAVIGSAEMLRRRT
jgi:outer membrane lipoprotein SlyB